MKRYQPYYLAQKSGKMMDHFRVGCVYDDYNVDYLALSESKNGQEIISTGGCFGFPELCPSKTDVPEQFVYLIDRLKQEYVRLTKNPGKLENIHVQYRGRFAEHQIEKYILFDHEYLPEETTPEEREQAGFEEWDNLMHFETTLSVTETGECQTVLTMYGDGHSWSPMFDPPKLVYDYFEQLNPEYCVKAADLTKGHSKRLHFVNVKDNKNMTIKNPELEQVIREQRIIPLEEFNQKYGIIPDIPLTTFRTRK